MRLADPQIDQRREAEAPRRRYHAEHQRRVMTAAQQYRQKVMLGGDDPGERGHRDSNRNDARNDRAAGRAPYFRAVVRCFQQRIAENQKRKSAVPDHVEPDGGLRAGAEKPVGGEQAGKSQGVNDRSDGGEQISAREQQHRARTGNCKLRKQQHRGDQVIDGQRRLIARNECRDRCKRHAGKRYRAGEQHRRYADHGERGHTIAARRGHGREKDVALVTHCRLRQTGSERAMATALKWQSVSSRYLDAAESMLLVSQPRGYASVASVGIN